MNLMPYHDAEALYRISTRTMQRLVKKGMIDAYRPGSKVLVDGDTIEAWIKTTRIHARKIGRPRNGARRV